MTRCYPNLGIGALLRRRESHAVYSAFDLRERGRATRLIIWTPSLVTPRKITDNVQTTSPTTGETIATAAAARSTPTAIHGRTGCVWKNAASVPGSTNSRCACRWRNTGTHATDCRAASNAYNTVAARR